MKKRRPNGGSAIIAGSLCALTATLAGCVNNDQQVRESAIIDIKEQASRWAEAHDVEYRTLTVYDSSNDVVLFEGEVISYSQYCKRLCDDLRRLYEDGSGPVERRGLWFP